MRAFVGGIAVALVTCFGLSADDTSEKVDVKKLIGKWEAENEDTGASMVMEFTKDGKLKITVKEKKAKEIQLGGAYKLEGNKVVMTIKAGDKEIQETLTVVSLTGDELVIKDSKGKKDTLERVEDKE